MPEPDEAWGGAVVTFTHTIQGRAGLHARPVAQICSFAQAHGETIRLSCNGQSVSADDIMGVMGLNGCQGDALQVTVEGPSEQATADELKQLMAACL